MMPITRARTILLLVTACAASIASAQRPDELLTRYRRAWHDEGSIYLKLNTTIRIERTRDGLTATKTTEIEQMVLKAPVGAASREEVHYSKFIPLAELNAWTMAPKENGYKKMVVSDFVHKDDLGGTVFHNDSRKVQFIFPGVAPGAITHLDHTILYPDARMVTGHFFGNTDPVEESTLTVIADKDVNVEARAFHVPDTLLVHERDESHGRVTQRWTMRKVSALPYEDDAPGFRYYAPHMQLLIRPPGGKTVGRDGDMQRLYAWYLEHVHAALNENDTMVQRIAREHTSGLATDTAKAAALYEWMQGHITYVAVEDGMNGFIPAPAHDVCSARYGDCKGMANLLRALMSAAGLKAHLAWVGSRALPYTYDELPASMVNDHMITAWDTGKGYLLLDPTSSETPFGMPSAFIQAKQAMVAVDSSSYVVIDVPVMPASASTITDTIRARLDGTTLRGNGVSWYTGYQRTDIAHVLRRTDRTRWKEVLRALHMKGNNRFQLDSMDVIGLDDRNAPLKITYSFIVPGLVNKLSSDIYLPPVLEKPFAGQYYRKGRKLPVEEPHNWEYTEVVDLELPAGTTVAHVPEEAFHQGPDFGYDMHYGVSSASGIITVHLGNHYRMARLLLEGTEMDAWRTMLDGLDNDMNRSFVITPPK